MTQLDRHMARRLFTWTLLACAGSVILFTLTQAVRLVPAFTAAHLSPGESIEVLLLLQVPVLAMTLAPAFAFAIFAQAASMGGAGEQMALEATGIGPMRIARSALLMSVPLGIGCAWLWMHGGPLCARTLHGQMRQAAQQRVVDGLPTGRFTRLPEDVVFYADGRHQNTYDGVFVEVAQGEWKGRLAATSAKLVSVGGAQTLHLRDGVLFPGGGAGAAVSFDSFVISLPDAVDPAATAVFPEPMRMSTGALMATLSGAGDVPARYELMRRLERPVEFVLLALVSIVLAFGVRWRNRLLPVGGAVGLFVVVFMLQRAGEVAVARGWIGAAAGALLPLPFLVLLLLVTWGSLWWKKTAPAL